MVGSVGDPPGREEVLRRLRRELDRLRDEYGIRSLAIYGSIARDEGEADSDVDVLVEFAETPTLFTLGRLQQELEETLDRPVDVTTPGGLRGRILERARRDAVAV